MSSFSMHGQPQETLLEITRQFGTPLYAYDIRRLRSQADKLRSRLPTEVEIYYSLKANASLGISDVFADYGLGADAASAGELATAACAGFPPERIFMAGPYKSPEAIEQLRRMPEVVVSVDSADELARLAAEQLPNRVVLRLRPDFQSAAVVAAGSDCRFGVPWEDLPRCRELLSDGLEVIGFHVFAGSQVLDAQGVIGHLRGALELSLRAAEGLGISPQLFNLGGGFGIPYRADEQELDLVPIGAEVERMVRRISPTRLALELGRYLVAQAGWYLTSVVGHQMHQGRKAVVVDGGTHQRADLCGLCLRSKAAAPLALNEPSSSHAPTDVLGCLSLPADVLAEASMLPPLKPGSVLAFANAGAYGYWSSPAVFHGYPLPAEVAFDGIKTVLMRERQPARSILNGQSHAIEQARQAAQTPQHVAVRM